MSETEKYYRSIAPKFDFDKPYEIFDPNYY